MLEYKSIPFEVKEVVSVASGGWEISGYASTFGGEPDAYGDVIAPGAFTDSIAARKTKFLFEHSEPIGKQLDIRQDDKGLFGRWTIVDTRAGTDAYKLAKAGVLDSLSIGFMPLDHEYREDGTRVLKRIDLFEVSAVAIPANENAVVTDVKRRQAPARKYMGMMGDAEPPEGSYEALSEDLEEAIRAAMLPAGADGCVCVIATYPSHAVANVTIWPAPMSGDQMSDRYFDIPYVVGTDGETITLGPPTEVEIETTFAPVKGIGLTYGQHAARVERMVREFAARTKAGSAIRRETKEGRAISEGRRSQLQAVYKGMQEHMGVIGSILDETDPKKAAPPAERIDIGQELRRRRLARHGIDLASGARAS